DGAVIGPGGRVESGATVTVDGERGRLLLGKSATTGDVAPEVEVVMSWAADLEATAAADPGTDVLPGAAGSKVGSSSSAGDLGFRVFHALRIKGMITAELAAAMSGGSEDEVRTVLDDLVGDGLAGLMEPRAMWAITPDGREAHLGALAAAIEPLELSGLPYQRFLGLNDEFKQLCTDWQVRAGEPNDHADADYDNGIRERLDQLDDRSQPIVAEIGAGVPWMLRYADRLRAARDRVVAGDPKALTGVMCDSYHDIWMELHEDLILTQGIDRGAEGST
ncbi:MAG: hypothetical protein ACR2QK_16375, partial [Acidimicrobiales bacterium]